MLNEPLSGKAPVLSRRQFLLTAPIALLAGVVGWSFSTGDKTVKAFVDTLLPADELGPAASEVGGVEALKAEFDHSMLRRGELQLLMSWLDLNAGGSFASATADRQFEIVTALDALSEETVRWKIHRRARGAVMWHYFSSAERTMALGLPGAPQPDGYPDAHLPWVNS